MARPKKTVTEDQVFSVYRYFRRLFNYVGSGSYKFLKDSSPPARSIADSALYGVITSGNRILEMQEWIDRFVSPEGVTRLWSALRQKTHRRERKPVMIAMDPGIHDELSRFSKRYNITLSESIQKLLNSHREKDEFEDSESAYIILETPQTEKEMEAAAASSTLDFEISDPPEYEEIELIIEFTDESPEAIPDPKKDKEVYRKHITGLIQQMKDGQGMNYRQIAEGLTKRGILTPGGKDIWSGQMVSRIYRDSSLKQ